MAYNQETIYQVYRLVDENKKPFYFGKGVSARPEQHFEEAKKFDKADPQGNAEKLAKIQELLESGLKPSDMIEIIKSNLNEHEAFSLEAIYIDEYWDSITNRVRGLSEEKRCFVKFDLSEPDTKIHYDRYIRKLDKKFNPTGVIKDNSHIMSFDAAKLLIEIGDIINTENICVVESLEIVSLLDLIGYNTESIKFISSNIEKTKYVESKCGCFVAYSFIEAKRTMKFDCLIMNPPFNEKKKFFKKALECSDKIVAISPASYLFNNNTKEFMPEIRNRLSKVLINDSEAGYFSAGVNGHVAISVIEKSESEGFTVVNDKTKVKYHFKNKDFVSMIINNRTAKNIFDKMQTEDKLKLGEDYSKVNVKFRSVLSVGQGKVPLGKGFYYGLTNGSTKIVTKEDNLEGTGSQSVVAFNSKEEALNAIDFYTLSAVRIACSYVMGSARGYKIIEKAPCVDFTKKWTREMVQKEFNITDEEWAYADNVINGVSIDD